MERHTRNVKRADGVAVSGPRPVQATRRPTTPVGGASVRRCHSRSCFPEWNTTNQRASSSTSGNGVTVGGAHPDAESTGAAVSVDASKAFSIERHSSSTVLTSALPHSVPSAAAAPLAKPRRDMGEPSSPRDSPGCTSSLSASTSMPSNATHDRPPTPAKPLKRNGQVPQRAFSGQPSPHSGTEDTSRVSHGRHERPARLCRLSGENLNGSADFLSGSGSRIGCAAAAGDDAAKGGSAGRHSGGRTTTSPLVSVPTGTGAKDGAKALLIPAPPAVAEAGASSLLSLPDVGDRSRTDSHASAYHGCGTTQLPGCLAGVQPARLGNGGAGNEGSGDAGHAELSFVSRGVLSSFFSRCPSLMSNANAGSPSGGTAKRFLAGRPLALAHLTSQSASLTSANATACVNMTASSASSHTEPTIAVSNSTAVMALTSATSTGTEAMPWLVDVDAKAPEMTSVDEPPHLVLSRRLTPLTSNRPVTTGAAATTSIVYTTTSDYESISEPVLTTNTTGSSGTPTKRQDFTFQRSVCPVTVGASTVITTATDCRVGSTPSDAMHAITESAAVAAMRNASDTAPCSVLEPLTSPSLPKGMVRRYCQGHSGGMSRQGCDGAQLCHHQCGSLEVIASTTSMLPAFKTHSQRPFSADVRTMIQNTDQLSSAQPLQQSHPADVVVTKESDSVVGMPALSGCPALAHLTEIPPPTFAAPLRPLTISSLSSECSLCTLNSPIVSRPASMALLSALHGEPAMREAIEDVHCGQQVPIMVQCAAAASPPCMCYDQQHSISKDGAASEAAVLEVGGRGTGSAHLRRTTIACTMRAGDGGGPPYDEPTTLSSRDVAEIDEGEEVRTGSDATLVVEGGGSRLLEGKAVPLLDCDTRNGDRKEDAASHRPAALHSQSQLSLDFALFPQTTPLQLAISTVPCKVLPSASAAGEQGWLTLFAEPPFAVPWAAKEPPADLNKDGRESTAEASREDAPLGEDTEDAAILSSATTSSAQFGSGVSTTHLSSRLHASLPESSSARTLSPSLAGAERGLQRHAGTTPPPAFLSNTAVMPALAACASSPNSADVANRAKDAAAAKTMPPSSSSARPLSELELTTARHTGAGWPVPVTSVNHEPRLCMSSSDISSLESKAGRLLCSSVPLSVPTMSLISMTQLPSNSTTVLLHVQELATLQVPSAHPCGTEGACKTVSPVSVSSAASLPLLTWGAATECSTAGASLPPPSPSTESDNAPVVSPALNDTAPLSPLPASLGDGSKVVLAAARHRRTLAALEVGSSWTRCTSSPSLSAAAEPSDDATTTWVTPQSSSTTAAAVPTPNAPPRPGMLSSLSPPPPSRSTGGASSLAAHGLRPFKTASAHRFFSSSEGSSSDVSGFTLAHRFLLCSRCVLDTSAIPRPPLHRGAIVATEGVAAAAAAADSSADVPGDDVAEAVRSNNGQDAPQKHDSFAVTEGVKEDERASTIHEGVVATVSTEAGGAAQNLPKTLTTERSLPASRGNGTGGSSGTERPWLDSLTSMTTSASDDPLHVAMSVYSSSKDSSVTPSQRALMDGEDCAPEHGSASKRLSQLAITRLVLLSQRTSSSETSLMMTPPTEADASAEGRATVVDTLTLTSTKDASLHGDASRTMLCADGAVYTNVSLLARDGTPVGPSSCVSSVDNQCGSGDSYTTADIAPTVPSETALGTATDVPVQLSQSSTVLVQTAIPADVGSTLFDDTGSGSRALLGGIARCVLHDAKDGTCPPRVPSIGAERQQHPQRAAPALGSNGSHADTIGMPNRAQIPLDTNALAANLSHETDENTGAVAEVLASSAAAASPLSVAKEDPNAASSSQLPTPAPSARSYSAPVETTAAGSHSVGSVSISTGGRDAGNTHAKNLCGSPSQPLPLSAVMVSSSYKGIAAASGRQLQRHESSTRSSRALRSTFLACVQGKVKRWAIGVLRRHRQSRSSGGRPDTEKGGMDCQASSSSQALPLHARTGGDRNCPPSAWKELEVKEVRPLYAGQGQQAYNLFQSGVRAAMSKGLGASPLLLPARPIVSAAPVPLEAPRPGSRCNRSSRNSSSMSRSPVIHTGAQALLFYSVLGNGVTNDDSGAHTGEVPCRTSGGVARAAVRRRRSSAIAGGDDTDTPGCERATDSTTTSGSSASQRIRHVVPPASSTVMSPVGAQNSVTLPPVAAQRNTFRTTPLSRHTFLSVLSGTAAPKPHAAGRADKILPTSPMPDVSGCPMTTKTVSMRPPSGDQLTRWTSTLRAPDSTAPSLPTMITSSSLSSSLLAAHPSGSSSAASATAFSLLSPEPKYAPTATHAASSTYTSVPTPRLLGRRLRYRRSTGGRDDPLGGSADHQKLKAGGSDQPLHHSSHLVATPPLSLAPPPQQSSCAPASTRGHVNGCYGNDPIAIPSMNRREVKAATSEGLGSNAVVVLDAAHRSAVHTPLSPSALHFIPAVPHIITETSCGITGGGHSLSADGSPLDPLAARGRRHAPSEKTELKGAVHDRVPLRSVRPPTAMPVSKVTSLSAITSTITTSTPYSLSSTDMGGGRFKRGAVGDVATSDAPENGTCGILLNGTVALVHWRRSRTNSFDSGSPTSDHVRPEDAVNVCGDKLNVATTTTSPHVTAQSFAPSPCSPFTGSVPRAHRSSDSIADGGEGSVSRGSMITASASSTGADDCSPDDGAANENAATPLSAAPLMASASCSPPPPLLSCEASPALFQLSSPLIFHRDRNGSVLSDGIPALTLDNNEQSLRLSPPKQLRSSVSQHQKQQQQERAVPLPAPPDSPARSSRALSQTSASAAIPSPSAASASHHGAHATAQTTAPGGAYTLVCSGNGCATGVGARSLSTRGHNAFDSSSSTDNLTASPPGAARPSPNLPPIRCSHSKASCPSLSPHLSGSECDVAEPVPLCDASGSGTRSGSSILGGGRSARTSFELPSCTLSSLLYIPPELRRGPQWRHLKQHFRGFKISSPSPSATASYHSSRVSAAPRGLSHRQATPSLSPSSAVLLVASGVGAHPTPTASATGRRRISDGVMMDAVGGRRISHSFKENRRYKTLSCQGIGMRPLDDANEFSLVSAINNATVTAVMPEWPGGNNTSNPAVSRACSCSRASDILLTTETAAGPMVGAHMSCRSSFDAVYVSHDGEENGDTAAVTAAAGLCLPSRLLPHPTHERCSALFNEHVDDGRRSNMTTVLVQRSADFDEGNACLDRGGGDTETGASTPALPRGIRSLSLSSAEAMTDSPTMRQGHFLSTIAFDSNTTGCREWFQGVTSQTGEQGSRRRSTPTESFHSIVSGATSGPEGWVLHSSHPSSTTPTQTMTKNSVSHMPPT
ncbi:hypothetical protein, unknown function [Leishmania tarentolae]|uniref:Uncharacterized protein n=1 Tax=Leishmania tarentolae TaxID=5689 RepID=A0A640K8P9_LEITA|nr:hypothetical protein, unknown function [Leishmania tarentolae]